MKNIHQTAVIEDGAIIGDDANIEAYAFVSKDAILGNNVTIKQGARVIGKTRISDNSRVFSYAIVGDIPQDISYKDEIDTGVIMKNLRKKVTQLEADISLNAEKGRIRNPETEHAIQDAEELRDDLQLGREKFFRFGLYVTLWADSLDELNFVQHKIETIFGQQMVFSKIASSQQEQGMNTTMPLCTDQLQIRRNMNTGSATYSCCRRTAAKAWENCWWNTAWALPAKCVCPRFICTRPTCRPYMKNTAGGKLSGAGTTAKQYRS